MAQSLAEQVTRLIDALVTYTTCQHGLPFCACTEKARNTLWNLHPASDGKGGINEELLVRNRREAINARRKATKAAIKARTWKPVQHDGFSSRTKAVGPAQLEGGCGEVSQCEWVRPSVHD